MLKAIQELGKEVTKNLDPIELFIQATALDKYLKVIYVDFELRNNEIKYVGVHIEDYDQLKPQKYLYSTFDHGVYDVTPTAKVPYDIKNKSPDLEKLQKRWTQWFGDYSKKYQETNLLIKLLTQEFDDQKAVIFSDVSQKISGLSKDEQKGTIISICIKEGDQDKYLGDFEIFRTILKEQTLNKCYSWGSKSSEVISIGNGVCSLCGTEGEVWGFASPFKVYTLDKRGFAPNFIRADSWKRLPICEQCAIILIGGEEFLNKYLRRKFYGYQFYVIPHFTFGEFQQDIIDSIKESGKAKRVKGLLVEENDILETVREKNDVLTLTILFLKPKQKFFDIIRTVDDVLPSWIKKQYDTFNLVGQNFYFHESSLKKLFGKQWANDFISGSWKGKNLPYMNMAGIVRSFFPSSKSTGIYDKYFIDIIGDILSQRPISHDLLVSAFIREIRERYVKQNEWEAKILSLKSLYLLLFLQELDLIKGEGPMDTEEKKKDVIISKEEKSDKISAFFKEFDKAFDSPAKRAIFLEGVLTKFLIDVQFANRQSAPFRSKLLGLRLDEGRIKKLLKELDDKLAEYKVGYPWLDEMISMNFIKADNDGWTLSKDEISYYFALGLNLGGLFKEKEEKP